MKKTAVVFAIGIVLPSFFLGWLALRTAGEQQIIIERQAVALYQKDTDELSARIRDAVSRTQQEFIEAVNELLAQEDPRALAENFSARLASRLSRAQVGFAVTLSGQVLSPDPQQSLTQPLWRGFLADNSAFLSNQILSEIYQPTSQVAQVRNTAARTPTPLVKSAKRKVDLGQQFSTGFGKQFSGKGAFDQPASKLTQWSADFGSVASQVPSGVISRFVQDRLEILFWLRPPKSQDLVFGAMLTPDDLKDLWSTLLIPQDGESTDVCLAILNERAEPVARSVSTFEADWKHPFAATEIGEVLPHWEAALYLTDPNRFTNVARIVTSTLLLLILLALSAIAWGSYLVVKDTRRQLALVQKKADFVSNVSHELKSPLTSIRMFAELLEQDRVTEPEKRAQYLRIVVLEAERLTRLINNVLDFAKLERNQKPLDKHPLDLYPVIQRTWEAYETHLRSQGFATRWQADEPPYRVLGDPDALAQILVNLLSNAEKYSREAKEVTLHTYFENSDLCIGVLDRGLGVPAGHERKIFEPFHRAHDSLASGIQGSGLGLTLAQRLAREHGGTITYQPRAGGGSTFTLHLPQALMSQPS